MEPWQWGLVPFLLVASYTDWRWQKIYNWLTFPAMALGFLVAGTAGVLQGGAIGAGWHLLSSLAGFGLWTVVFLVLVVGSGGKGMKAGDLKLGAAIGAWLAWPLAVSGLLYAFITGGVLSIAWALAHGALGKALVNVRNFFWAMQSGVNPTLMVQESAAPMLPYGVSLAIGTMLALVLPPLLALPKLGGL